MSFQGFSCSNEPPTLPTARFHPREHKHRKALLRLSTSFQVAELAGRGAVLGGVCRTPSSADGVADVMGVAVLSGAACMAI